MAIDDYGFIRDTAAKQRNFTIPPLYVLWLLARIKGEICFVAEDAEGGRLAYLLAVPVSEPPNALFVWQLAARNELANSDAVRALIQALKQQCLRGDIGSIYFSSIPNTAVLRILKGYIREIFDTEPIQTSVLHELIAPGEVEFRIDLK